MTDATLPVAPQLWELSQAVTGVLSMTDALTQILGQTGPPGLVDAIWRYQLASLQLVEQIQRERLGIRPADLIDVVAGPAGEGSNG